MISINYSENHGKWVVIVNGIEWQIHSNKSDAMRNAEKLSNRLDDLHRWMGNAAR